MWRRRIIYSVALLAALCALSLHPNGRRLALVGYLLLGDWTSPEMAVSPGADQIIMDAGRSESREALTRGHGELRIVTAPSGSALVLTAGADSGAHEICTRRFPRDWSGHKVLRLQFEGGPAGKAEPVHLTLRVRSQPGMWETIWYYQRVLLRPSARHWEVSLAPARQFIDPRRVRQLCLALDRQISTGPPPMLSLKQISLVKGWTAPGPAEIPAKKEDPFSMHVVGDSTRLRRHDRLPRQPHLLGKEGEVLLRGARNEVLAFQLVIRSGTPRKLPDALVSLTPVQGPGGYPLDAELFSARFIRVSQVSSALYGLASPGPGEYSDPLVPLTGPVKLERGNNIIWIDLHIPTNAPPGPYQGTLEMKLPYQTYRWPVQVKVAPAVLPSAGRQLVMVYYLPQLIRDATRLKGEALLHLERAYHRLAQAHGAYLVYDTGLTKLERYLPMIQGTLYRDGPAPGQGAPFWPVPLDAQDKEGLQRGATAAANWFRRRKLETRPFAYLADEPASREDYQQIIKRAGWVHGAPAPGNELPVLVTEQVDPEDPGWPSLVGSVDYWVSADNFPEPAATRRQATKERFFTYNGRPPQSGSHLLDAPGTSLRTWGWIAHLFRLDMWFLWQGTYYRDIYNGGPARDPLKEAETYDRRRQGKGIQLGNGDGVLLYPPPPGGTSPLGSIRLKALRRGVQDLLYLRLAEKKGKGGEAMALARKLIPRALGEVQEGAGSWPEAEAPWEAARLKLLELVTER